MNWARMGLLTRPPWRGRVIREIKCPRGDFCALKSCWELVCIFLFPAMLCGLYTLIVFHAWIARTHAGLVFVCLGQCPASLRHKICAVEDGWPLFDGIKGSLVGVPLWERSVPPSFPGPKSDGT